MTGVAKLRTLLLALAVEPRFRIGGRLVRLATAALPQHHRYSARVLLTTTLSLILKSPRRAVTVSRHNHPVLEQLLLEAMKSVTITQRGSQERLTPEEYSLRVLALRNLHIPSLRIDLLLHEPDVENAKIKETILNLLRNELKAYLHEDRTHAATFAIFGGSTRGSSVDDIFRSLLQTAIVDSPRWAALAFFEEIDKGYLPYREFFLLTGVHVETHLQVFDGISLIPLPSSSQELPGFLPDSLVRDPLLFLSRSSLE